MQAKKRNSLKVKNIRTNIIIFAKTLEDFKLKAKIYPFKHNRLNVGRIALERIVGALINCSLLQSVGGRGSLNGTKKFYSGLQITTLEVNIYHY